MTPHSFAGKRVLVTGSSRGIGFSTAKLFLEAGARVAVNGSTEASTLRAVGQLGSAGAVPAPGDVSGTTGCRAIVSVAVDRLGGLDILVNSAGLADYSPVGEVMGEIWDRVVDTNLKGTFFCLQEALPALRATCGAVVNVASDAGLIGERNLSVYCASKGGVVNLTRALAMELAPGVRVNCVCPGYTDTDMVRRDVIEKAGNPVDAEAAIKAYAPMKRITAPGEVAALIAFLCSGAAASITGGAFVIDGGATAGRA